MSAKPFDSTILADAAGALDLITNVLEASTEYSEETHQYGGRAVSTGLFDSTMLADSACDGQAAFSRVSSR